MTGQWDGTYDGDALRAQVAEGLNGEWPNCFCDGFQDAVAGYVGEVVAGFMAAASEGAGGPPAEGHRRLRDIGADIGRADLTTAEGVKAMSDLAREWQAASNALLATLIEATVNRAMARAVLRERGEAR